MPRNAKVLAGAAAAAACGAAAGAAAAGVSPPSIASISSLQSATTSSSGAPETKTPSASARGISPGPTRTSTLRVASASAALPLRPKRRATPMRSPPSMRRRSASASEGLLLPPSPSVMRSGRLSTALLASGAGRRVATPRRSVLSSSWPLRGPAKGSRAPIWAVPLRRLRSHSGT